MPEGVNLLTNTDKYGRSQSIVQSGKNEPVPVVTWRLVHTLQVQEAASLKTVENNWSPGHAALKVQGQLNGGSPDYLTLCRGLVGKLFHVPVLDALHKCGRRSVTEYVCSSGLLLFRRLVAKASAKARSAYTIILLLNFLGVG